HGQRLRGGADARTGGGMRRTLQEADPSRDAARDDRTLDGRRAAARGLVLIAALLVTSCRSSGSGAEDARARVEARIDALHTAASRADGEAYFACFARGAVFVGTDASEHWTI